MTQENLVGMTILGYAVTERLGSGAFGTVYKAVKSDQSGRYIRALKHITIPTERQYADILNSMGGDVPKADDYFAKMLKDVVSQIQILNDLSQKSAEHIVRYYEHEIVTTESPRRYDIYIVMEYLIPLEKFISVNDFTVRDVVRLGMDVLSGLDACHEDGVIHRDIRDDNIFVSTKGEYKIGDFGVSKVLRSSSTAESLKGASSFLAPEVCLGREGFNKSVDLYSLGIVLYRLLNYSRNPFLPHYPEQFYANDEDLAFEKRMRGETPDHPSLGGAAIGDVVVKAISGKTERFQSAGEFLRSLQAAANDTPNDILAEKIKHSKGEAPANQHLFDAASETPAPYPTGMQSSFPRGGSISGERRSVVDDVPKDSIMTPEAKPSGNGAIKRTLMYMALAAIFIGGVRVGIYFYSQTSQQKTRLNSRKIGEF